MQHSPEVIAAAQRTIDAAFLTRSKQDFWAFLNCLVIPSQDKGIALFRDVIADFQQERFAQIVPSLNQLVWKRKPPCKRYWWEATKGAAKDADLAIIILWVLIAARHPLSIQVGAGDEEQASIVKERAKHLLAHNPWLSQDVEIQHSQIVCKRTKSQCVIESADARTIHGGTPDLLILNELHVTERDFADALFNNAHKVTNGLAVIATNSGHLGTWQYEWRDIALESAHWETHIYSQPSPWTSEESLQDAKRMNTEKMYKRLWHGVWTTEEGESLPLEDIEWMMTQHGGPLIGYDAQWAPYIAALDFGLKHDHAAFIVMGMDPVRRKYRIAHCRSWKPRDFPDGKVSPNQVQNECWELCKRFQILGVAYDPWQFASSAEWLASQWDQAQGYHVTTYEYPQNPKNLSAMATALLNCLREKEIEGYPDKELKHDLLKLAIEERIGGYKLTAVSDALTGHADRAMALALVLPWAQGTMRDFPRAA